MPAFLNAKPRLHGRHVLGAANPMADACSRGRFQNLHALCARLGVHPKRLHVPPDVAAFLGPLAPEHGAFNFDLLPLAGDVEEHPGPSGRLAAIADALRETHSPRPLPPPLQTPTQWSCARPLLPCAGGSVSFPTFACCATRTCLATLALSVRVKHYTHPRAALSPS
eukprot:4859787-Pleurochrysis_carterae.AAC.1